MSAQVCFILSQLILTFALSQNIMLLSLFCCSFKKLYVTDPLLLGGYTILICIFLSLFLNLVTHIFSLSLPISYFYLTADLYTQTHMFNNGRCCFTKFLVVLLLLFWFLFSSLLLGNFLTFLLCVCVYVYTTVINAYTHPVHSPAFVLEKVLAYVYWACIHFRIYR